MIVCSPDRGAGGPTRRLRLGHRTCLASAARVSRVGLRQSVGASSPSRSQTTCKGEERMECMIMIIIIRALGNIADSNADTTRLYICSSGTSKCLLQLGRCNVAIKSIYIMHLPRKSYLTSLPPRETGLDYFTNRGSSTLGTVPPVARVGKVAREY